MKVAKRIGLLAVGVGLGAMSSAALAQSSCSSVLSNYDYYASISDYSQMEYMRSSHPECFGSSASVAASTQTISATSLQHVTLISDAISSRFSMMSPPGTARADAGQLKGMAAGNAADKWNFWANLGQDSSDYDRGNYAVVGGTKNHKASLDVTNLVLGTDYALSPVWTVGVSAAFDHNSGSSWSYTNGAVASQSEHSGNGYSIAPYAAWQINKELSLDATLGFGKSKTTSTGNIEAKSDRLFYGANLNYVTWRGNWQLSGKGSYFYGEQKTDDLTTNGVVTKLSAVKSKLDQIRLGGQAGYWLSNGVMPYVGLTYLNDLTHSTSAGAAAQNATEIGKTAWLCTLGVNFFSLQKGVTGGLTYNLESGRDHAKREALMANLSVRF